MPRKIEYIEYRLPDILGQLKGMTVPCKPTNTIEELKENPEILEGTSVDGSSILGLSRVESSDLRLDPDLDSLVELPYSQHRTAAVMCFVRVKASVDKKEFYPKDTRGVLHSVCEKYLGPDMMLKTKVEPEFYFTSMDGEPFDFAQYAETFPKNPSQNLLLDIASAIQLMGVAVRVVHHEVGIAQQEVELAFEEVLRASDNILLFKNVARALAAQNGIDITFMPKPFTDQAGTGLHCHLQLWEEGVNLFGDKNNDSLSDTAKNFLAGLMNHAPAITAIANPTINSYKRLEPHQEAPVYISWGMQNRTTLIRVPLFQKANKAAIEFRSPDPTSNPYLVFAAIIAAGMEGVREEMEPIQPVQGDVFNMSDSERDKNGIKSLPVTLKEALDHLKQDTLICEALGKEITDTYIDIKLREWNDYVSHAVTDWEWNTYFDM
ncbi:glutamine synthetase [Candidatus Thorarchaeota archaeon]|nr:MAG: glutamine synthetase [Candidatus Thorarchaeota archaeon]